jgi:hypothetical protein
MDKKIQHSMSTMIDLLQPSNDNNNDYSPAEYTQLLNRFLAFDEEMSEIACLYKDCQTKMISISRNSITKNRNQMGIIVKTTKKKICKKTKRIRNTEGLTKENFNRLDYIKTNRISTESRIIDSSRVMFVESDLDPDPNEFGSENFLFIGSRNSWTQ